MSTEAMPKITDDLRRIYWQISYFQYNCAWNSIYETQNKYNEALAAYENALRIFPEYKYNYLNIANVQYQTKDYKKAIDNYNMFLSTYSQHWEARKSLANSYLADGNPEKAAEEFENLYVNNNDHFDDYANYGIALYKIGNYDKSVEYCKNHMDMVKKGYVNLSVGYISISDDDKTLGYEFK